MDVELGGDFAVERLQELLELDRAAAGMQPADDLAGGEVQRRVQARRAGSRDCWQRMCLLGFAAPIPSQMRGCALRGAADLRCPWRLKSAIGCRRTGEKLDQDFLVLSRHTFLFVLVATAVTMFRVAVAPASATTCSGAAARDPHSACAGVSRWLSVTPTPAAALTLPVSPCEPVPGQSNPPVCTFGAAPDQATATIALVGDSHAAHWRDALAVVARAKGWFGYSMAHSSCPLQVALRDLPEPRRSLCATWKREVFAWFAQHREVHTVFVAGLSGGTSVVPTHGRSRFATSVAGYMDAWRALAPWVTRVIVIRDTPKAHINTNTCVERAMTHGQDAGLRCAVPRSRALDRDPAITAAASMPASQAQSVDLTRYFCGSADCYPVIGGDLVLRDETHMTSVFSATLGPYLQRAVDAALARFADADRAVPTQPLAGWMRLTD